MSNFNCSLLVYRKAIDFYYISILILYSATCYNLLLFPECVVVILVDSLGFSTWTIMPPMPKDSFISAFPICICFISFYCLIAFLGVSVRCWKCVIIRDILSLFLILLGKHLVSHCISLLGLP